MRHSSCGWPVRRRPARCRPRPGAVAQGVSCDTARPGDGDPDLYCIELLPAPGVNLAAGVARLRPPSSPFGLAVTPAGAVLYDVDLELPEAPDLTPFPGATTLVAWAATPQFDSEMRLGEVRPGVTRVGRIPFDRFLVLVSAEPSARVTERTGRVLLRGTSAAVRMQPHDMAFVLAGLLETPATSAAAPAGAAAPAPADHDAHAGHAMPPLSNGWVAPPMYPGVLMPPALMTLRPDVSSYLPGAGAEAPVAQPRSRVRLADGDTLELVAAPVRRTIDGRTVTMLGFNGQYPGPLIQVPKGRASPCASSTARTCRRPCTGTACGSTTASTASRTSRRSRLPPGALVRLPRHFPRSRHLLVSPAPPRGRAAGPRPLRQPARALAATRRFSARPIARRC